MTIQIKNEQKKKAYYRKLTKFNNRGDTRDVI